MKIGYFLPFLAVSALFAVETKTLDIYPNAAFLHTQYNVKSGDFRAKIPDFVKSEDLLIQSDCAVKQGEILKNATKSSFAKSLATLQDKKRELLHQKEALNAQKELLKSYQKNATNFKNIAQDMQSFQKLYLENLAKIDKNQKEIDAIDKKISSFIQKNGKLLFKRLHLKLQCKTKGYIKFTYSLPKLRHRQFSEFNAQTKDKKLTINQQIFITHPYGNLLRNVKLRLFSSLYNASVRPSDFYPDYLKGSSFRQKISNKMALQSMPVAKNLQEDFHIKALISSQIWEVKNAHLPPYKENKITFSSQSIDANFDNVIDAYAQANAYLKCTFTPKEYVMPSRSVFSLDGMMIGKDFTNELVQNDKTHLFFGQNSFLKVQKELLEKMKKSSLFKNRTITKVLWKYTIVNQSEKEQKVTFIERVPVSQDGDIKVKSLGDVISDDIDRQGRVVRTFSIDAKGKKVLHFGYEIERPND